MFPKIILEIRQQILEYVIFEKNMAFTHALNLFMKTQHFNQHFMQHFNILVGFKSLLEKF